MTFRILWNSGELNHICVERAIAEVRAGRPVLIEDPAETALAVSVDGLGSESCTRLRLPGPVALDGTLDGRERRRDPALPRTRGARKRHRQQDPRLQAAGAGLRHLRS